METPKTDDTKTTPETETKKLSLPRIEDVAMVFDKDTKMFYVGIPADKVAPFEATVFLDSCKLSYLQAFLAVKATAPKILTLSDKARQAAVNTKNFLIKSKRA